MQAVCNISFNQNGLLIIILCYMNTGSGQYEEQTILNGDRHCETTGERLCTLLFYTQPPVSIDDSQMTSKRKAKSTD